MPESSETLAAHDTLLENDPSTDMSNAVHVPRLPTKPGNVGTSVQLAALVSCQSGMHGHCLTGVLHGGTHGVGC
jgi:hypothetical protein